MPTLSLVAPLGCSEPAVDPLVDCKEAMLIARIELAKNERWENFCRTHRMTKSQALRMAVESLMDWHPYREEIKTLTAMLGKY